MNQNFTRFAFTPSVVEAQRANAVSLGLAPQAIPGPVDVALVEQAPCLGAEHEFRNLRPAAANALSSAL